MNWLSFFIGVLVGWIVEWIIDFFYWRRRYQVLERENEALHSRLNEAEKKIKTFQVKGGVHADLLRVDVDLEGPTVAIPGARLETDLKAPEVTLPAADVDVDLEAPEAALPAVDMAVGLAAPEVPDTGIDEFFDDLKARFPDVDLDGSIRRLKAKFPDLDLKTALQGLKVDFPDIDIDGAFDSLKAKFARVGERQVDLPPMVELQLTDDLKLIEGIGPKISALLRNNGILTFAQLADAGHDRLEAILRAGGPNFRLADPATWPEQARLAADGAWDDLQALQDRLIGGQRTRPRRR
ncbi:MAG: hypothetical protein JXA93_11600 [Anaerolineae bacterium]|nr:hypothetical protein [Anaerolineae bacterium]